MVRMMPPSPSGKASMLVALCLASAFMAGCSAPLSPGGTPSPSQPAPATSPPPQYVLRVDLWRDFMPGNTDDSLHVVVYLEHPDGRPATGNLTRMSLQHGPDTWTPDHVERQEGEAPRWHAWGGPTWPVGDQVLATAWFKEASGGEFSVMAGANVTATM